MSLVKAMATVGGLTGLSRIAGFIRDILTAAILGAGPIADAFFVALKLPNMFRKITAEGAFNVSFVPLYSETLEKEGAEQANKFAGNALSIMLWVLSGFTLVMILVMPWVIYAIAPGFQDDPLRYDMAVELSRITFPYLLFMSVVSLFGGVLNAHERFAPFAAAPIFFNLSLICALLFLARHLETAGHAMAWGVFAAGIIQFSLLFFALKRAKIKIRLVKPHLSERIKKLFKLMLPGILGAGVLQINLFADLIIASFLDAGSISYLYYADRLNQLPLGIVGIAVGTALLPMLSKAISAKNIEEASNLFNRAMEICLLLALPAAIALMIVPIPLISVLFERGAFTLEDTAMTGAVLMGYAVGLPAYIVSRVFQVSYWARQDTATPVKISIIVTIINISLSLTLINFIGVVGISLATGIAGWLQFALLRYGLRKQETAQFDKKFLLSIKKIVFSAVLMGAGLIAINGFLENFYNHEKLYVEIFALLLLVGTGVVVYFGAIILTGAIKVSDIKTYLRRKSS